MSAIKRVLVADHQALCRAGLASLHTQQLGVPSVVEAADFAQLLACIERCPGIQMVVANLDLPGMRREIGLRQIRTAYPAILLVVVAESRTRELVLESLCAGVHGYILKDLPTEELVAAFESIMGGQIYVPVLVSEISARPGLCDALVDEGQKAALTERQHEVLTLAALGRSNKEIARSLRIAEGTVKVHITAAFRALGVHNRVSAAAALQTRPRNDNLVQALLPDLFGEGHRAIPVS